MEGSNVSLLYSDEKVEIWIDTEKDISFLKWGVRLNRYFNHASLHGRQYWGYCEVDSSVGREWMIVVHGQ